MMSSTYLSVTHFFPIEEIRDVSLFVEFIFLKQPIFNYPQIFSQMYLSKSTIMLFMC
jgi:hypothetical protein